MPSEDQCFFTSEAPAPLQGAYSQSVKAGPFLYTSCTGGMTKDGKMVEGSIQDRARQVLKNLEEIIKPAGYDLTHVVQATIYLSHLSRDFGMFNEVWKEMMPAPRPARSCIGAELPLGTDVAIEFTCYKA